MDFDLVCSCGAGIRLEVIDDDYMLGAWLLIHRFTNAHVSCGFMTSAEAETLKQNKSLEVREKNEP